MIRKGKLGFYEQQAVQIKQHTNLPASIPGTFPSISLRIHFTQVGNVQLSSLLTTELFHVSLSSAEIHHFVNCIRGELCVIQPITLQSKVFGMINITADTGLQRAYLIAPNFISVNLTGR